MKKVLSLTWLVVAALLVITACANGKSPGQTTPGTKPDTEDADAETPNDVQLDEEDVSLGSYLLPDGSTAHFKGEGNEFAELDIEVTWLDDTYVVVDENNGGALVRTVYAFEDDQISIVAEDPIDLDVPLPSVGDVTALEPIEVYLKLPLKEGATFDQWTVTDTDAVVETPYDTFDGAIVIESKEENAINRKYFVPNYGEVKRESIMKMEDGEDFIVTSSLESVELTD